MSVISQPDIRWGRVDIKTIGLLPNALAKQAARERGSFEAWLIRDGKVTEGASSNAWIITEDGTLITHPATTEILGGITRSTVLECAKEQNHRVEERPFTLDDAKSAKEAFLTSATGLVMPIVKIDDAVIGSGTSGPQALALRQAYKARAKASR